jgi:choline dehydrogenase
MSNGQAPGPATGVVIVGGGAAGSVLAARLSEDPSRSVLLLEAGPDYTADTLPDDLRDPAHVPGEPEHDWGYVSRGSDESPEIPTPRGKAIGGSSAVNAAVAMRARASDFAKWRDHGVEGWSFDDVLPTFKALENTPDGDDEFHGRSGPFPIRQRSYDELTTSLKAFIDAANAEGFARVLDFNGAEQHGVGAASVNIVDGVRQSSAQAYLTDEVRRRPNLTVRGDAIVDRVLFDGTAAVGVTTATGEVIGASEVVLSGGTYGSASILLRSGVGPAGDLARLGIPVLADLPVGQSLQDHPFFYNAYALKIGALDMEPVVGALLWTASSEAQDDELDLHITATHLMDPSYSPTGGAIVLATSVVAPDSRGTFALRSHDPHDAPLIDNNFLATERDRRRLVEGVRLGRKIARHPTFARVLELEILPGGGVPDDAALEEFIVSNLAIYGHPVATAPMGDRDDPQAVVDADGAVHGLSNLRVVDASIIPTVTTAATNLTTIMVAEHIARRVYGR